MVNSSPPPKRPRRFFIEDILADEQKKEPKDYVKKLDNEIEHVPKFQWMKNKSRFSIEDVPADPEGLLMGIFQHCMDEAIENCRFHQIEPTHLGCMISSQLLTSDIWIPIRQITPDTINTILNRFNDVAQSKKQDGITLWGDPFTVTVTALNRNGLNKKQLSGGAPQKLAPVHHRIHDQCLIKIQNNNTYCLFYAMMATLVHSIRGLNRQRFYDYMHGFRLMRGMLERETAEMMEHVDAPIGQQHYDAEVYVPRIIDWWNTGNYAGQFVFKAFIFASTGQYKPLFKYGPDAYNVPIVLYYVDEHFHGVQKSGNLFGKPYCLSCEKTYDRSKTHDKNCKARCIKCSQIGPSFPCKVVIGFRQKCTACNKTFFNDNCYQHHISTNFCRRSKECKDCGVVWDVIVNTMNGRESHKCNEKWCENCQIFHDLKRGCYIQPIEPNKKKEAREWRLVTFDVETMQHAPVDPAIPERRKHEVNFVTAKVACSQCISSGCWKKSLVERRECNVCGPHRTITFSQRPFRETLVDKQFVSRHPLVAFVKWILYKLPLKYDTVIYSHFGGRFDMVLVFRELFMEGLNPSMIRKGNRLFEMKVKKRPKKNPTVIFRDSWNLVPGPLASMVPMFSLDVQDKPFFPHLANRPENYGQHIHPSKSDFLADGMMPEKRKEFDIWYEMHKDEPFLLDESLASYCKNDVDILMEGLITFRAEFLEMTKRPVGSDGKADRAAYKTSHNGVDPVRNCVTIASACMRHFRTNHLKPGHLALVPEKGYDSCGDNQSDLALNFMEWYSEKYNVRIQNAYSAEGEKRVGNFRLDGWIEDQQKGLEIHGCVWHACGKCYPDDSLVLPSGKTAGRIRERNKLRMDFIYSKVPNVEIFWECDIRDMLARDKKMRKKFDEYTGDGGPIDIRGCFMGGRTGALKLYHEAAPDETISYYDFTSLYPFINFVTKYPVGHPKLHVPCEPVDWRRPEDNPYPLAILKVFVIPPRQIDIPVLPVKVGDRLCFPLCMACCKKFPDGAVMDSYRCKHEDRQRGWISTCTSLELDVALEEGYRVTELLRVLEYSKGDDKLFRPYISEFIAQKMHSSGFDDQIRGNYEAEEEFIKESMEKFGIKIDRTKMVPNKGKRSLAKLGVNNLWGRFSLRNFGLSQTLITDDPSELGNYLDNRKIEITSLDMLTPETILISYQQKKDWIEEHPCSNVVISLFTTSAARIHLLRSMQKVARTPGCTLLYTDTDSLIYAHPNENNPLKLGPHLGQLTNEFPKHTILEFVSGGSKQYALKLRKVDADNEFEYLIKVRGITLSHDVIQNQGLRFETFKERVLKFARSGKIDPIHIVYPNFLKPSVIDGSVISAPMRKIYKPYVGKGIVCSRDFRVLDFGYIPQ